MGISDYVVKVIKAKLLSGGLSFSMDLPSFYTEDNKCPNKKH